MRSPSSRATARAFAGSPQPNPGSHGIVGDVARKDDVHPIALQVGGALGGLDVLVHNASSLGPVPLAPLADTECEDFELALATNVLGPFRLTKALLGLLAASARESGERGARALVVLVSSDAAVTPYAGWGAYGASKAALAHMGRIWNEELAPHGIAVVVVDPGDMDTPMHAAALPDADPATLRRPRDAAREIVDMIDRERARPRGRGRAVKAATLPVQRPRDARLLVVDAAGRIAHRPRSALADTLVAGDLVVANDAATLPASLAGRHAATGAAIEVRLAGRASLAADDVRTFVAVVFGAGDHRTPTERRPPPPPLAPGDALVLGPLRATVVRLLDHPRLVELRFAGDTDAIRAGIARHGRPVQYAHVAAPLALWDVWTRIAALPVAFEAPSAGFVLDWQLLERLAHRAVGFATLTHAAGLSSTGDAALDARLPLDEPYRIPASTVAAIAATRRAGGRIVALGTTVARALEHAATRPRGLAAGAGVADNRLGAATRLALVDAIVSGTHEPGTSHHELLRAFVSRATLARVDAALEGAAYRTHEFGDSIYVERGSATPQSRQKRALGSCPVDPHAAHERAGAAPRKRMAVNSALTMPVGTASVPQPISIISEAMKRPSPVLGVMSPKPTVVIVEIAQ